MAHDAKIEARRVRTEKRRDVEGFIRMAKEFHLSHGCIGSESFETCTAEVCQIAHALESQVKA